MSEEEVTNLLKEYRPFWDRRWEHPHGGDGQDTTGEAARKYHDIVADVIRNTKSTSILDVGCGALNQWPDACPVEQPFFTGMDISNGALDLARNKWPNASFFQGDITQATDWGWVPCADLVVCTDVLNHIREEHYDDVVNLIFKSARKAVIIRMWTNPEMNLAGNYHWNHEPPLRDGFKLMEAEKGSRDMMYYVYKKNGDYGHPDV
jgi:SAM-dependent methyltransferase